ncbi:MAG: c-type cytochrome [Herbaspirillum sp.]|nr:c-type cytochrome [Herbaspirillum sp.]
MRKLAVLLICAAAAAPALALDTADNLARSKNCMACHSIGSKVVGPAFKEVAKRYAGQPDAAEKLVQKVLKGGSGAWGVVPMPANTQVSEAEARTLVQWVLSVK